MLDLETHDVVIWSNPLLQTMNKLLFDVMPFIDLLLFAFAETVEIHRQVRV